MDERYIEFSNDKLMELTKDNDLQAFKALVERNGKKAYLLALKLVGDPADAQDISQEAADETHDRAKCDAEEHRNRDCRSERNIACSG